MVNSTIWSLLAFVHVLIAYYDFHFNILQDVERECLNQLNVCLINILDIYSVPDFQFQWPLAFLHWQIYIENHVICSHS